ncbi:ribonuclease E/G-like protein, chloroplastic isoform X2 [Punica granatum]|uniref:Ribonuclease E/G-like protein, chloroplastic isoform X2 n=1 Tax=Punica granatum TaxID=22663 RepID=A0A6P8BPT6_PUNGR|nr:ribonuclease E/G-like protein, chloroplastic isoform X2 [Punica granatum]
MAASLLKCCPYATEAMDIPEAIPHRRHHRHLLPPPPPPFPCFDRFLSPCICPHPLHENVARLALSAGGYHSHVRSPVMCMRKGKSILTSKGSCEIVWTVEAELTDGQQLYVTGDPAKLGCWNPGMAIPMSRTSHANIWKTEIKIEAGVSFKYNYFIKEELRHSDIIWRPGPEFSLLVPLHDDPERKIMVRDSWIKIGTKGRRSSTHAWGSWIEEKYLPNEASEGPPDEDQAVKCIESDTLQVEPFFKDLAVNNGFYTDSEDTITLTRKAYKLDATLSERDQPVEEPWLLWTLFPPILNDGEFDEPKERDSKKGQVSQWGTQNQLLDVAEKLSEGEKVLASVEDTISTVLLINSSICTMQRIAVLEDGKLVELLLEPVKSNVQCDSMYLGIVTKLVPNMGGAFVNIGNSRHSLMDIKKNRAPFIFPPFSRGKGKQGTNGSVSEAHEGQATNDGDEHASHDCTELIDDVAENFPQDIPGKYTRDEYEENEDEDDFDVLEILKGSANGSLAHFRELSILSKDNIGGHEKHEEGDTNFSKLLSETEVMNSSQVSSLKDRDDSMETSSCENSWNMVRKGTKIIVQVVKEGLGSKGPTLTPYPKLRSRFWVLITRCDRIGVSKKISGMERTRLKVIAKTLQPQGFGLTVRTVAAGHSLEELQKDLEGLLSTWKNIIEHAKSAALAADEGVEGAVPVILHRAMGQTLSVVQDYFNEKVKKMVVDSPRTFHEVTNYLQEIAPDLCDRVELYNKRNPLFDEYNIEAEIDKILSKRVPLANGGSLVIEQTEALVSIDVNGGHGMFGQGNSQERAILEVNLSAARQIARELRLRDIGGIIVVDFIDMADESNKRLVYEEVKKIVERDRSIVKVSELSKNGLMEITRKRVRPSVTFMISEPCACCHATGRVEALETSFSKIEQEICRLLATMETRANPEDPKSWPRFILRVDHHMCEYLTSGKKTRIANLSSSLKVWILLKVARGFTRGEFEVKPFSPDSKGNKDQHQAVIPILRPTDGRAKGSAKKVTLFPVKKFKATG